MTFIFEEFLKNIYNFIIWVNEHLFMKLDIDIRIDAFIGILGVLIAIVIFIAETMNNEKMETKKRFILEKTQMKEIMIFSICILTFCIIKGIITIDDDSSPIINIIFFVEELLLNICIIKSILLTIKLFVVSLRLNTDSDYFFNEYGKYIERRLFFIHNKNISFSNKKLKNESIQKFVKDNAKYFSLDCENTDGYVPIKANKSGIFKTYSYKVLQTIIDKIEDDARNGGELIIYDKPLILLNLKGGEKINRGVTIAYCNNHFLSYEDSIKCSCLLNDSIPFPDNEINLIIKDLFSSAENTDDGNFDSDNRLIDYFRFLYKNDMRTLLDISYEYIRKIYVKYYTNKDKNSELARFLSLLSSVAYSNGDYEKFKFLGNYIYYCYSTQLNITNDIRETSYEFSNSLFRYKYYSIKDNNDFIYYDVLMSNFLSFLFDLLAKKEFEAIGDLFQNIIFDYNGFIDDEPDNYDIVKMQFSFGFIYGLIILSDKGILKHEDKKELNSLIYHIKSNFVEVYSQNKVIEYFKEYYNLNSNVQNVYSGFCFKFENKEYRNSWSGVHVDDASIIKEYINVFDIDHSDINTISLKLISKSDKYLYKKIMELIELKEKPKLEKILDINKDNHSLMKVLKKLIEECDAEEAKYIKNNPLSAEKINTFKNKIVETIENGNELIVYLNNNKKYSIVKRKSNRLFGLYQIIDREIFFEDIYGLEGISTNYGHSILNGITKDYLKKLDGSSILIKKDFTNYIKKLDKGVKYVIITSPSNLRNLNITRFNSHTVEISDKKLDLIIISNAKDIYLVKKSDLPKVDLLKPDIVGKGVCDKGIYFELIDCSTNTRIRNKIQKETVWLKEKGTVDDQIEYLKSKCALKLFISPSINKTKNFICYKFVMRETDD